MSSCLYTTQGELVCTETFTLPGQVDPAKEHSKDLALPQLKDLKLCDPDKETNKTMCNKLGGDCLLTYASNQSGNQTTVYACVQR